MGADRGVRQARGSKTKISVTVDREVWDQARALPWAESASEAVNEALRRMVASERLGIMLDHLEGDFGPVDETVVADVEARWFGE